METIYMKGHSSPYKRIMIGNRVIHQVIAANTETQEMVCHQLDEATGKVILHSNGEPARFLYDGSEGEFRIEDIRDGGEGKPSTNLLRGIYNKPRRRILVMGGGPSLPGDLEQVDPRRTDIKISINHHALMLGECDWVAFIDRTAAENPLTMKSKGKKLCVWGDLTDYRITDDFGHWRNSGSLGLWLADFMGGDVLMLGFDCYQGKHTHFHGKDLLTKDFNYISLDEILAGWRKFADTLISPERVKAVSGPLQEIFGCYK